jgi:hypothetical protein
MSGKGGHGQRTGPGINPTHCDTWSIAVQLANQRAEVGERVFRHFSFDPNPRILVLGFQF